jgi:hypothetical protein
MRVQAVLVGDIPYKCVMSNGVCAVHDVLRVYIVSFLLLAAATVCQTQWQIAVLHVSCAGGSGVSEWGYSSRCCLRVSWSDYRRRVGALGASIIGHVGDTHGSCSRA